MSNNIQTQSIKGKRLLMLLSLMCFVLLVVLMMISGNSGGQAYAQSELAVLENAKVEVLPIVVQKSFQRERVVYGQVESSKRSNVGFELSGILKSLKVSEGQSISKGQPLATLDLARLDARENELNATLNRAQADARLAQLSAKRVFDLVKAKLEPQQRLDEVQASLDAAQARVNEVDARLASLKVEKQKSTLLAPFDGQVLTQLVDEGTVLSTGEPVFSLISTTDLEARFGLPENTAFGLKLGEQHSIQLGESSFPGLVKSVAKQRALATRTIDAVFSIDKNSLTPMQLLALVSGDLVSIRVMLDVEKNGAWIPLSALSNGVRGLWTVLIYQEQDNTLVSRTVAVEHLDSQGAFVSGAIRDGEQIVVNGTHRFTPGQTVRHVTPFNRADIAAITSKEN